jgi:hypothetical protein
LKFCKRYDSRQHDKLRRHPDLQIAEGFHYTQDHRGFEIDTTLRNILMKPFKKFSMNESHETTASGDTAKQGRRYRELINYIQNVTKGTIHEHSPHTQDLLRFLNSEIDLVEKAFSYGYWSNGVSKQTSWEQFKRDNGI